MCRMHDTQTVFLDWLTCRRVFWGHMPYGTASQAKYKNDKIIHSIERRFLDDLTKGTMYKVTDVRARTHTNTRTECPFCHVIYQRSCHGNINAEKACSRWSIFPLQFGLPYFVQMTGSPLNSWRIQASFGTKIRCLRTLQNVHSALHSLRLHTYTHICKR
jgi:hypothetical protein